jgi:TolB-like protein/Tfp pilus assembly protein PilF
MHRAMNPKNFFAELKRRNVYKVAVAYAVIAWLLIQAGSILFPTFEAPGWVMKVFVAVVAAGFPLALVIAWAFEMTPEGMKRTEDLSPNEVIPYWSRRKFAALIVSVAVAAAALLVFQFIRAKSSSSMIVKSPAVTAKSIAVLPFENLSRDPDNAFFADGIQDEILSTLGKINDLRVISRTSTAKYKSRPDNLRQVATELGAGTILEGSVQRATDRVRVIVQLIDATTDAHLWSDTYDRELKDIFSVQSEIAQKIATSLKTKLSADDKQSLGQLPTQSAEAHELYLKAGYFVRQVDAGNGDPAHAIPQAIALYQEAIAKDPGFALAYAQMSFAHSWAHWFSVDDSPERVHLAAEAARKAMELNPQLAEAHLALGFVAYWGRRDFATAMAEFEFARKLLPNDAGVSIAIASIHRRRGEWESAIKEFSRAATLDPRNPNIPESIAYSLAPSRRYDEALGYLERALAIQPDYWGGLCGTAAFHALNSGDAAQAKVALSRIPANVDPTGQVRYSRFRVAMWLRQLPEAVRLLDGAPDWIRTNPAHRPVATSTLRGQTLEAAGQTEAARVAFAAAIPLLEERIKTGGGEPSLHLSLGRAYAGMGRKADALREGQKALELLPVSKDAFDGPSYLEQFAELQARVGNTDEAISILRQLLEMPAGLVLSPAVLSLDPAWDPIRNDPRFQKLSEKQKQ